MTDTTTLDTAAAEAFAARMLGVLNDGALALMLSVGHRLGLFDAMSEMGPSTSEEIAATAGLHERYVREWLGAMVTGDVVRYDPASRTYALPPEHAASITRAAGPENLAIQMQFLPLLATVEEPIVECFRSGGGVPYSEYHEFHRLMAEDSAAVHDVALVDAIVPLVPGMRERLRAGIDVADVGCGSGHAVNLLAEAFPESRFTGYDFSDEAIATARREAEERGVANARFEVRDVTKLGLDGEVDLVTAFDAIHDQAHPASVLEGVFRALRPGGTFLMVDIRASSNLEENLDHPIGTFLYTVSAMHCMTVSLALGGDGLGTVWGEQLAQRMLAEAGFDEVALHHVDSDPVNSYYVATKADA